MSEIEQLARTLNIAFYIFCVFVIFKFISGMLGYGLDDSDRSWNDRSGMKIRTDAKTGLQYFEAQGGGLTPRLNLDGSQMIEGQDDE